jgi:hypothetical protein
MQARVGSQGEWLGERAQGMRLGRARGLRACGCAGMRASERVKAGARWWAAGWAVRTIRGVLRDETRQTTNEGSRLDRQRDRCEQHDVCEAKKDVLTILRKGPEI